VTACAALWLASVAALVPVTISAHSLLLASSPPAGAVVSAPPPRITLSFNNRIEKAISRIRLVDGAGRTHDLAVGGDGPADTLTAPVPPLDRGAYRVEWQVFSTDGHVVSGAFSFRLEN
jgi:methionine-rich copper-binding protein CopC